MWTICEKLGLSWKTYEAISRIFIFKLKVVRYRHFPWIMIWPWFFFTFKPLCRIPLPMWFGRFYYRVSFWLWRHPSCYHWKRSNLMTGCSCKQHWEYGRTYCTDSNLYMNGHRCFWCGCYAQMGWVDAQKVVELDDLGEP